MASFSVVPIGHGLRTAGVLRTAVGVLLMGAVPDIAVAGPLGLPFDDYNDLGALRLQLGATSFEVAEPTALPENHLPMPPRLVYETKGKPDRTSFVQLAEQLFVLHGKCEGALDDSAGAVQLATMDSSPGPLGFGPDSIGVYDGPRGVGCYRISASENEQVEFGLGPDLRDLGVRSFYRIEFDVEVKQNARFVLQVLRGGAPFGAPWILESGSSVTPLASEIPGARVFLCSARSDSAPDAGASDNCRWVINEVGDGFRLYTTTGDGSLEGGGDWGTFAYDNNTVIFLTDVEVGVLGCGPDAIADESPYTSVIGDGVDSAQCAVTRVDPTVVTGGTVGCTENVAYLFRSLPGGIEGCEIRKTSLEQVAAVLDVTFPWEPRVELNSKPLTVIQFPDPALVGTYVSYTMPRCKGTLDPDANDDGLRIDGVSPDPTIVEVLTDPGALADPPATTIDVIPGGLMEWACILEDEEFYVGKDALGDMKIQVRQKILFWGDPIVIRQSL